MPGPANGQQCDEVTPLYLLHVLPPATHVVDLKDSVEAGLRAREVIAESPLVMAIITAPVRIMDALAVVVEHLLLAPLAGAIVAIAITGHNEN